MFALDLDMAAKSVEVPQVGDAWEAIPEALIIRR
jgi:hypothetical protein